MAGHVRTRVALGAVLLAAIALAVHLLTDVFRPGQATQAWGDGEEHGRWVVEFTGYGEASGNDDEVVLQPRSAESMDITHGGLVRTAESYQDADFEVSMLTEKQVRDGEPNVWEVGWVLWNYSDNDHFYAVALKPNGWEISKQDPAYPGKQRFIASGHDQVFPIGQEYRVKVEQNWPEMTVSVDGRELATVTDDERPYRGGSIGLYTEDARVRFTDLTVLGTSAD
ncbi:calcium-binding protein [Kocuria coralli]|uniref:calcium-binding protein n=1 Tax=Kocuria coralli TaxID=1461025 RepID=UPI0015F2C45B|nr:calcium-binding protein [Kocuria coralli]